ncbi:MAG: hypothetical protein IPJ74_02225 [Saprospiraceae bacterium]|nr:hypothetical protein [Saprospiraceae bacterium]
MKKQILFVLTLMVALICFNSCEKEALEAPATATNDASKEEPMIKIVLGPNDRMDSIGLNLNDQIESREAKTLWITVYSSTLYQGNWSRLYIPRANLDPNYRYTAILTPYGGNPDLYIQGKKTYSYTEFRTIRYSINPGAYQDSSVALLSDLRSDEDTMCFSVYAQTNTQYILYIYREPITIYNPLCRFGC